MPRVIGGEEAAVCARGLVKRYGDLVAVDGLDLVAHRGTCLGILGPNGAGKTTTIEMLEGLKRPDEGEIEILGHTWTSGAQAIRERIGVQLQETQLQEKLTAKETLRLFRSFYDGGRTVEEALELVALTEKKDARVVDLSGGQKQRLTLATALISRPEVLFLDEPSTGLDPQARRRVWEIVENFKSEGGTVLLTTHYMEEAERLADELMIVDHGKVITAGTPAAVIAALQVEGVVEVIPAEGESIEPSELEGLPAVRDVRREGSALVLTVLDTQASVGALLSVLTERGVRLEALHTHRPTLEDVFMDLTGKHLRDE